MTARVGDHRVLARVDWNINRCGGESLANSVGHGRAQVQLGRCVTATAYRKPDSESNLRGSIKDGQSHHPKTSFKPQSFLPNKNSKSEVKFGYRPERAGHLAQWKQRCRRTKRKNKFEKKKKSSSEKSNSACKKQGVLVSACSFSIPCNLLIFALSRLNL